VAAYHFCERDAGEGRSSTVVQGVSPQSQVCAQSHLQIKLLPASGGRDLLDEPI